MHMLELVCLSISALGYVFEENGKADRVRSVRPFPVSLHVYASTYAARDRDSRVTGPDVTTTLSHETDRVLGIMQAYCHSSFY